MDRESIIRKLKKLRAKAESAEQIGSEAEAQTFAEAVQRMLSEYKVEAAEIAEDIENKVDEVIQITPPTKKYDISFKRRESTWMQDLASVIAWGHYCRMAFSSGTNIVYFIGREADATVAAEVWCKLVKVGESLADKEYVKYFYECKANGNVTKARGFKYSFLVGFVSRLNTKIKSQMEEIQKYYANNTMALVVLRDSREKVDEWVEKNTRKVSRERKERGLNKEGFSRGQDKAAEIPLSGPQVSAKV